MLMLLSPLYLMFGLAFRSEQARLVLALDTFSLERRRPAVFVRPGEEPTAPAR